MSYSSHATIAAYYQRGIEAGVVSLEQAKEWAFSIIESLDKPPGDVIEVAMSQSLPELIKKLDAVEGEPDWQLAGRWLLYALYRELKIAPSTLHRVGQQAMQVAQSTCLGEEVFQTFSVIDDCISLAECGTWGSIQSCHAELESALEKYGKSTYFPD